MGDNGDTEVLEKMYSVVGDMPAFLRMGLSPETQEVVRAFANYLIYDDRVPPGEAEAKIQKALVAAGYNWTGARWDTTNVRKSKPVASGVIVKTVEDKQLAFGWANVIKVGDKVVLDRQKDFIDDDNEIEKAAYDYVLHSRDGGEMHLRTGVADLVESMVFTDEKIEKMGLPVGMIPNGWWVGFKFSDGDAWSEVKSGRYGGFSVHGTGVRTEVDIDDETHSEA